MAKVEIIIVSHLKCFFVLCSFNLFSSHRKFIASHWWIQSSEANQRYTTKMIKWYCCCISVWIFILWVDLVFFLRPLQTEYSFFFFFPFKEKKTHTHIIDIQDQRKIDEIITNNFIWIRVSHKIYMRYARNTQSKNMKEMIGNSNRNQSEYVFALIGFFSLSFSLFYFFSRLLPENQFYTKIVYRYI